MSARNASARVHGRAALLWATARLSPVAVRESVGIADLLHILRRLDARGPAAIRAFSPNAPLAYGGAALIETAYTEKGLEEIRRPIIDPAWVILTYAA